MSAPASISSARLAEIVGAGNVASDPAALAAYEVDGVRPAAAASPGTQEEVAEVVRFAAAERLGVIATGGRTKLCIGMAPQRYDVALDMTRLRSVLAYDPGDLTLGVEAGIRLEELASVLEKHGQFLPLAAPFGSRTTIGGTLATNADSPLRQLYGTARDFVLGMEFVTGEGVRTKSGGRVVKNVTGYDLHKLMIGALGTLGIITRVNFRTFPLARASRGFVASFSGAAEALEMRRRIAESALRPATLEIFSPGMGQILARPAADAGRPAPWLSTAHWWLAASFTGDEPVLARYEKDLMQMAEGARAAGARVLSEDERQALWERLRECIPLMLESSPAAVVFRTGALPARLGEILEATEQIAGRHALPAAMLARGVGTCYCALLPAAQDEDTLRHLALACNEMFAAAAASGARATIEWCPTELKRRVNVWGEPREDFPMMQKLKKVFDPQGILSAGRFVGGL
ncbi:MAG TPA: FAD-binding oxidoreductase [Candidatus Acidoferrales bacterium]|jgi:glycolate oxidase FAD binding subunit|nr:FAD-binding oxidoreductase [Candidatus Acidoferrales bacterium]